MLRSIAKSAVRPFWTPVRHRLEHMLRAQISPLEASLQEQVGRLNAALYQVNEIALGIRGNAHLGPRRLYPFAESDLSSPLQEILPGSIFHGSCPVCGHKVNFSGFTSNLRESGICSDCGSFNRQRQMAATIRRRFQMRDDGPLVFPAGTVIYNTETTGAVHAALRAMPDYLSSEYFGPEFAPGTMVGDRRHEDLQRLSFSDGCIDLVLSSDVLEHMPAPYIAHEEIFRVLRPGGRHIFTVPFIPSQGRDDVRAELINGEIVYRADQLFHGDPVRPDTGVLVWTIFGMEMLLKLSELRFEVTAWNVRDPERGILGELPVVFEAKKPLSNSSRLL